MAHPLLLHAKFATECRAVTHDSLTAPVPMNPRSHLQLRDAFLYLAGTLAAGGDAAAVVAREYAIQCDEVAAIAAHESCLATAGEVAVEALSAKYGHWGMHPRFTRDNWQRETAEGDTGLGYWAWVVSKVESAAADFRALVTRAHGAGVRRVIADVPLDDAVITVELLDVDGEPLDVATALFDDLVDWMRAIAQEVQAATAWEAVEQVTVGWEENTPPTYFASGGVPTEEGPLPFVLGGTPDARARATA